MQTLPQRAGRVLSAIFAATITMLVIGGLSSPAAADQASAVKIDTKPATPPKSPKPASPSPDAQGKKPKPKGDGKPKK